MEKGPSTSASRSTATASATARGNGNNAGEKTTEAAQPPKPEPPPNYSLEYITAISAILAGNGPTEDLFEPLERRSFLSEPAIGTLKSTKAKQLYSLAYTLQERAHQMKKPRKEEQIGTYNLAVSQLMVQAQETLKLFWHHVHAELPQILTEKKNAKVTKGWVIAEPYNEVEHFSSMFDLPGGLVAHILRERREEAATGGGEGR